MNIFISWSGNRGKYVATALKDWLPLVVQHGIDLCLSEEIEKGRRGSRVLADQLERSDFGIAVLTPESQGAPWINFETGALSKKVEESRVWTFLYEMSWNEVQGPLKDFQHTKPELADIKRLVESVHRAAKTNVRGDTISKAVEKLWPDLLTNIKLTPSPETPRRSADDMLLDVVQHIRATHPLGVSLRNMGLEDKKKDKHWHIIEGECAHKPFTGQPIIPFVRRGDQFWPQSAINLDSRNNFRFRIWLGEGTNIIYIITPNELGRALVDQYRRVYEETKRAFQTRVKDGKDTEGKLMDGMWIGIKMTRLPPGLEIQASLEVQVPPKN
jgi:hypothetical protein